MPNRLILQTYKYIPYPMFSQSVSCRPMLLMTGCSDCLFFWIACVVLCVLFVAYLCPCNSLCKKFSFSMSFSSLSFLLLRIKKIYLNQNPLSFALVVSCAGPAVQITFEAQ